MKRTRHVTTKWMMKEEEGRNRRKKKKYNKLNNDAT